MFFNRKLNYTKCFSIIIPPPNITGQLTIGHLLNNTIQDIFARYYIKKNWNLFWIPGLDHAGISTQVQIIKLLRGKKIKFLLKKKFFLLEVLKWKFQYKKFILDQLIQINISCNLSNTVFTLDSNYYTSVIKTFIYLYTQLSIFKKQYLINWCCLNRTSVSDEEIVLKNSIQIIYKIKIFILNSSFKLTTFYTSRIESMLADVAMVSNTNDSRYLLNKSLSGYTVNIFNNLKLVFIKDSNVDYEFGTGLVKITPGHSQTDFLLHKKNNLKIINILNLDGSFNNKTGIYFGTPMYECRKKIYVLLRNLKIVIYEKKYNTLLSYSEKSNLLVEPLLSNQWFLKYSKINNAKHVANQNLIVLWPSFWKKIYINWLTNIKHWCISRQLWWGHKIPIIYLKNTFLISSDRDTFKLNLFKGDKNVLDTWASSWLWHLIISGWPHIKYLKNVNFKKLYPYSLLVTGPDILFFWVIRMILASLKFLYKKKMYLKHIVPFKYIYFTGIVRDELGRKLSKSLGNSPKIIDFLRNHNLDCIRYSIVSNSNISKDFILKNNISESGINFSNKLFHVLKYCILVNLNTNKLLLKSWKSMYRYFDLMIFDTIDNSITLNLINCIQQYTYFLEKKDLNNCLIYLKNFIIQKFCTNYIEFIKNFKENTKKNILNFFILNKILNMIWPFMPTTVDIYSTIQQKFSSSLNLKREGFWNYNKVYKLIFLRRNLKKTYIKLNSIFIYKKFNSNFKTFILKNNQLFLINSNSNYLKNYFILQNIFNKKFMYEDDIICYYPNWVKLKKYVIYNKLNVYIDNIFLIKKWICKKKSLKKSHKQLFIFLVKIKYLLRKKKVFLKNLGLIFQYDLNIYVFNKNV